MNYRRRISSAVMCAATFLLALTGIGTFVFGKPPMTHWVLMAHVAVAPLFAIALAAVALSWSGAFARGADSALSGWARMVFWLLLACGLVVMLSGIVPMTPLFGTRGGHFMYLTHRYSAIVLAILLLLHLPSLLMISKNNQAAK